MFIRSAFTDRTRFCVVHCCKYTLAFHRNVDSMNEDVALCRMVTAATHEATFEDTWYTPRTPSYDCSMTPGLEISP